MKVTAKAQDAASLFRILDEQAALFQQWLSIEDAKKEALYARAPETLEDAVKQQTQLLVALDRAESERRTVARRIVGAGGDPTLPEVAEALPVSLQSECRHRADRLKELIAQVQQANELGQALMRHAAAHNQALLEALVGVENAPCIYDRPGVQSASHSPTRPTATYRIDRQA